MMSESSKRHSKFLSLIFILKCLSKASVIRISNDSVFNKVSYTTVTSDLTEEVTNTAYPLLIVYNNKNEEDHKMFSTPS